MWAAAPANKKFLEDIDSEDEYSYGSCLRRNKSKRINYELFELEDKVT
jgi:hypothetical protein